MGLKEEAKNKGKTEMRLKEEGQDGDGAATEAKKEKNGRMRLVGG